MSWVLILTPGMPNRWPAIIGGYRTEQEALTAGEYVSHQRSAIWSGGYIVIPGAADTAPKAAE